MDTYEADIFDIERLFGIGIQLDTRNDHTVNVTPDYEMWRKKPILQWDQYDVYRWIMHYARSKNIDYEYLKMDKFNIIPDGTYLCSMNLADFVYLDPNYGALIYNGVKDYWNQANIFDIMPLEPDHSEDILTLSDMTGNTPSTSCNSSSESESSRDVDQSYYMLGGHAIIPNTVAELEQQSEHSTFPHSSDDEDSLSVSAPISTVKVHRGRGRPPGSRTSTLKKDKGIKLGLLWEFIRGLLHDPASCPSLIRWENYNEGSFRFVRTDSIAQLWGSRKSNHKMNYEKLSRALRYYYKTKVFLPVLGKRLVYKFGPSAHGWETSNPNFERKI